jgi:hypothetical protein
MQDRRAPIEFGEVVRAEEQKARRPREQARRGQSDFRRGGGQRRQTLSTTAGVLLVTILSVRHRASIAPEPFNDGGALRGQMRRPLQHVRLPWKLIQHGRHVLELQGVVVLLRFGHGGA